MDDVFVYCFPLPEGISEMVVPCEDGYTIYIDDNLCEEKKKKALEHALKHIRGNDWRQLSVQTIEAEVRQ